MNNLGAFKRFALTFTIMLIGINLWGQSLSLLYPNEPNSETNPYLISSSTDWNTFASDVNVGYDYSGKYIKLENDIEINVNDGDKMVGVFVAKNNSANRPFNGIFDGNWKTINFICGTESSPISEVACTLFRYTTGVTINNLKVTGTIVSSKKFAAGFVGWYQGSNSYINNCISSVIINCSKIEQGVPSGDKQYDCSAGGFIGQVETGTVSFENCIFNGSILKGDQSSANRVAGFVSYNGGTGKYYNCTMGGEITVITNISTFQRGKSATYDSNKKSYYKHDYGDVPVANKCIAALDEADGFSRKYMDGSTPKYVPGGVITGFETTVFSGSDVPATITPVVKYYGWTLAWNTDYDIKVNDTLQESGSVTLSETGDYVFTIEGKGNYGGTFTQNVKIFDVNAWVGLQAVLADDALGTRNITLSSDVSPIDPANDGALVVKGTVVLDLNGYTINRNIGNEAVTDGYVIKVESGANLTINNSSATNDGVITGGYNLGDGGGIVNKGTLTLNAVTVSGNKVEENRSAYGVGAGIYNEGTLTMNNCIVKENVAIGGGGGVHSEKGTLTINGGEIKNNSSNNKGGGVRVKKNATITGCAIKDNLLAKKEANDGGGFYSDKGSTVTLIDCEISGNNAERWGGGIYVIANNTENNTTLTLKGCRIEDNTALKSGGGIYMHSGKLYIEDYETPQTKEIKGTIIQHNTSIIVGGVCVHDGSSKDNPIPAEIYIKGKTIINENYGDPFKRNLYIDYLAGVINVNGALSGNATIGVSKKVNDNTPSSYIMTSGLGTYNPNDGDNYFKCDDYLLYWFELDENNEIKLNKTLYWNEVDWDNNEYLYVSGGIRYIKAPVIVSEDVTCSENIDMSEQGAIFIEKGIQFVYTGTPVTVSVYKEIQKAPDASTSTATGWYTISSPVNNPNIITETSLITSSSAPYNFDLLRYDEPSHYWDSYTDNTYNGYTYSNLDNGRGYLYRNANDMTVEFKGGIHSGDVTYSVTNHGGSAEELPGFNLIGNPFTHNITLGNISLSAGDALSGGYVLNKSGAWTAVTNSSVISPCQGVLVQVTENATATFSHTAGNRKAESDYIGFTVANSEYEDVAYALFDEGHGLDKISHLNEEIPMLYINKNDKDFAIATMDKDTKMFDLNFEVKTTGRYTLSVKPEGSFSYIHVFDKLANKDIDMLKDGEYEFIGSTADAADRFVVRLGAMNGVDDEAFVFQSGSDIIVNGEGELQVFDVMGRNIMNTVINGMETVNVKSHGVYIFRLNEKTQKIIVR